MRLSRLHLNIASDRFHFLKFILEGYDGLVMLSSVNGHGGTVLLRYPPMLEKELYALLTDLAPRISRYHHLPS
ncbi:MAG: DUF4911 domain-containing protein [Desulfobulbaceae bacterium]|uniref:DUF4911 domain-containing protein n=1 Tax=Candidatus Desulfatifera sulfidica TaxID=2841691 RepID=A0A8J6TC31_9BACT|nr:DUF4911 domain-containing protein [Candidatus Desulfatifera sulfidica]